MISYMKRILISGAGGIGGVNFINALKIFKDKFFIVGLDFNKYYLEFPNVDVRINSPRHLDPNFIKLIHKLVKKYNIDFLHPHPSSEAFVISQNILSHSGINVAQTKIFKNLDSIEINFKDLGNGPLWIRAKSGAGGNLSLLCNTSKEVEYWMKLWILRGKANVDDFMLQQFLPGRNIAWDSFWYEGKLIASFTRERLEYPLKHISPSGITGTPSVSRIIVDEKVNNIGIKSVLAIDKKPHGNYAVDLKEDIDGNWYVTEIDSGKFHTTTPLWGYASTKFLKQDPLKNLPYLYTMIGLEEIEKPETIGCDIYPNDLHIIRHIDCGTWLYKENGYKEKIL